jgi:hypothetical protein
VTAAEVAARVKARRCGKGWIGRCPAHADRTPSLSIVEGRDGRVLLRCFAGCEVESVVRALGLSLADLFARTAMPVRRTPNRPNAGELYLALAREERKLRERHSIEGLLRTSEINAIRATVAKRYGFELAPIQRPLWEGGYGGRERDHAWPGIFDWAMDVTSVRLLGALISFDETRLPPKVVLLETELLAACAMRDLEREAWERQSAP